MVSFYRQYIKYLSTTLSCVLLLTCFQLYGSNIYILFTANINGNLENCNCSLNSAGGIGRITTLFSEFRKEYPNTIIIDGGDYFNSYSFNCLETGSRWWVNIYFLRSFFYY